MKNVPSQALFLKHEGHFGALGSFLVNSAMAVDELPPSQRVGDGADVRRPRRPFERRGFFLLGIIVEPSRATHANLALLKAVSLLSWTLRIPLAFLWGCVAWRLRFLVFGVHPCILVFGPCRCVAWLASCCLRFPEDLWMK